MLSDIPAVPDPSIADIADIVNGRAAITHFQPILSVRQKSLVGLEALTRGSLDPSHLIAPKVLFRMAAESGVAFELENVCRQNAVRGFSGLADRPSDLVLFLNLSLSAMGDNEATAGTLQEIVRAAGLQPRQVAVEILEAEIDDMLQLCELIASFRNAGFLIVLDDVGAGHSNLDRIPLIKPDILKVDRSLISQVDSDYYKQETLKSLVGLSRKIGALVVAEGIETEGEAIVSLELGVDLLQGYFLGEPAEEISVRSERLATSVRRTESLAQKFKRYMVRKIHDRRIEHRRCNLVLSQVRSELAKAASSQFDSVLTAMIAEFPDVECIYVLNEAGTQVTETIGRPRPSRRDAGIMFNPVLRGADHSLKEYYYILLGVELQQYTTEPYVSLTSGSISRTISTCFRDAHNGLFVLCIDFVLD
jgi:EAL domain-containing protein (putative c-di-GMP-specific phosphodiesterase class I)